jgi:hypothetical protein
MDQKHKIIEVAQSQINYKEGVNNATKYGAWYGMDNQPWCAMFISWCAAQAGISEKIIPKLAYVPYMVDFFKAKGLYRDKKLYWPRPGDIIFFGDASHVGLVESVSGNTVVTIEGNTSRTGNSSNGDGVYRRYRNCADNWIMGYACPAYEEETKMEVKNLDVSLRTVDGMESNVVTVAAVMIDNENYIRLRDLPLLIGGVAVDYDEDQERPFVVLPVLGEGIENPTKTELRAALATLANGVGV